MRAHDGQPRLLPLPEDLLERRARRIELLVRRLLPPVEPELLVEVPLRVEQTEADQRDAKVRRGLTMAAGEDAHPPRVDRNRVVKPDIRAELRYGSIAHLRDISGEPRVIVRSNAF